MTCSTKLHWVYPYAPEECKAATEGNEEELLVLESSELSYSRTKFSINDFRVFQILMVMRQESSVLGCI